MFLFGGPGGNRTPASAMRMPRNTTLLQALLILDPFIINSNQKRSKTVVMDRLLHYFSRLWYSSKALSNQ